MKRQPRRENVPSPEKITKYDDLSMKDLADLMMDDTFRINSKNNRKLPRESNRNHARATRNERVRLNQEHKNIPASVPQRQTRAGPQQGMPGLQAMARVLTDIACQNAETMGQAIEFSHQGGVAQLEPAPEEHTRYDPSWQAMAGVQHGRATSQTVCAQVREDSTLTLSRHRMALRNQMGMDANVLLSRSYRERPTPAGSVFLPSQYPGMIQINQISGEDIPGPAVQPTRAPADYHEMHLPCHEIPEATGTPPETPHAEAELSSRDAAPFGHMQQYSNHLVEPEPTDDGAVPILTTRIRSSTRIRMTSESRTSMTRISTAKEISVPVSQTRQRLEAANAKELHMAPGEDETLVRKMMVPAGRIGASSLPGRNGEFGVQTNVEKFGGRGLLDPTHVVEGPFIGREARVVRLERRQEPGEPQDQTAAPRQKLVKYVMHQAPSPASSHTTLKRGQHFVHGFVPRPPTMVACDDAKERVLGRTMGGRTQDDRTQVGSVTDELEAAYSQLKERNDCSRFLNPLLRKMGAMLVALPCAPSDGPQFKKVPEALPTKKVPPAMRVPPTMRVPPIKIAPTMKKSPVADKEAAKTRAPAKQPPVEEVKRDRRALKKISCEMLCWDLDLLSELAKEELKVKPTPAVKKDVDDSCVPICWSDTRVVKETMPAPKLDRDPGRRIDTRPPTLRPVVPPPQPAACELRAVPQHVPERQPDTRPLAPHPAVPPPQPATRELRAGPQVRRLRCCPRCNAKAALGRRGRVQEQQGVQPRVPATEQEFRKIQHFRASHTEPRFESIHQATRVPPVEPRFESIHQATRVPPAEPRFESIHQATRAAPAQRPRVQAVQPPSAVQQGPQLWCCDSCVCPEDDAAVQRARLERPQQPLPQDTVDEDRSRMPQLPCHKDLPPMFGYRGIRAVEQLPHREANTGAPHPDVPIVIPPRTQQETSHEAASDRTLVTTPNEQDDECILEPYVERFHFTDEELAKAFPRDARAIVASAAPTSVFQETEESIVSRQRFSIVGGNVKHKTWQVKKHSRTKNIQRFPQSQMTQISETSATFLNCGELKCDDKELRFFQVTSKDEDSQAQKFHVKQAAPEERTLPLELIKKEVHPSKSEAETVSRVDEVQKQPTLEHESCDLLCWDIKEDAIDTMKFCLKADPVTKYDSSCMVLCCSEPPTDDATSALEISGEETHDAYTTDEATPDVRDGAQVQD